MANNDIVLGGERFDHRLLLVAKLCISKRHHINTGDEPFEALDDDLLDKHCDGR